MKLFDKWRTRDVLTDLPAPYRLTVDEAAFLHFKVKWLYEKILKRCYALSAGLDDDKARALFDSVELGGATVGLIGLVARALTDKTELILVNDAGIVRVAEFNEAEEIKKDYAARGRSEKGVYLNFAKYTLTDILKCYMSLIFEILKAERVNVGLAQALQVKINRMRETISTSNADDPMKQAKNIVDALKGGKSVAIDAGDVIQTTDLQTQAVKDALLMVYGMLASDLGVSLSFVCGELTSGLSVSGEANANFDESGIRDFFITVFKPIVDKLFGVSLRFKTDNWRKVREYAQILPYIESSALLSDEQKEQLAAELMGVGEE